MKKNKKMRYQLFAFAILVLLNACGKGDQLTIREVGQNSILFNLDSTVYDIDIIFDLQTNKPNMTSFCEKYGIQHYKKINDVKYLVLRTTDGIYFVFFSIDETHATAYKVSFSSSLNKEEVDKLCAGMTLQDVYEADPEGTYPFMYSSWSGYPRYSYHCFENGDCYFVIYDGDTITNISKFTI